MLGGVFAGGVFGTLPGFSERPQLMDPPKCRMEVDNLQGILMGELEIFICVDSDGITDIYNLNIIITGLNITCLDSKYFPIFLKPVDSYIWVQLH